MKVDLSTRPRVFLSSAFGNEGEGIAQQIAEQVRDLGGEPLLAGLQIENAGALMDELPELILSSVACIVVVSEESGHSKWQKEEWSYIQQRLWDDPDFKVIPVVVGRARLPPFLSRFNGINLSEIDKKLGDALKHEFDADDNSVELTAVAKEEIVERYGSMQAHLEESIVALPEEFSDYSKKYLDV